MRQRLRKLIPSMFHRRLLLLLLAAAGVSVVLMAQTARLTLGDEHARAMESVRAALEQTQFIPTVRGRLLDRYGRVLAEDESAYDVAVSYSVIVGDWAYHAGMRTARQAHRGRWGELGVSERQALAREHQQVFQAQVDQLWETLAAISEIDRIELETRKNTIRRRVQSEASYLWARWHEQKRAELGEDVPFREAVQPIRAQRQSHTVLFDVSPEARGLVETYIAEASRDEAVQVWNQVEVRRPKHRRYPLERMTLTFDRSTLPLDLAEDAVQEITVEGVAIHTIGAMRPVWREDFERRPLRFTDGQGQRQLDLGGYRDGDQVGAFGIEQSMEDMLRGLRGRVTRRRDTGAEHRRPPESGRDVRLTIDIQLQARVQGLFSPEFGLLRVHDWHGSADENVPGRPRLGDPLNATAVVLEVHSGEVLAAVGTPGFSREELANNSHSVWGDTMEYRHVNRPVARPYPPGSTLKSMVLAAGLAERKVGLNETIECLGHYYPDRPNSFRCWIHGFGGQHGHVDGAQALQQSCNIYFYALGDRLGPAGLSKWLPRFGLGATTGSGLRAEVAGQVPDVEAFRYSDHVFLGIGQGPVTWTVLQAAAAHAALARDGEYLSPTFIADPVEAAAPRKVVSLGLSNQAVRIILDGLDRAANETRGTAYRVSHNGVNERIFNVPNVRVLAKSGTAQTSPTRMETPDGEVRYRRGNHAWTVALVQPDGEPRPTHVVAVVVEHGGSGGRVAGPVVNQIIHAMQVEGYF